MRQLDCHLVSQLPKLAWVATVDLRTLRTAVLHGPAVEAGSSFFVEGCWSGPFSEGRFDRSDAAFATGAVALGDAIVFVPPAHTVDSLFYSKRADGLVVSNSLPLLLARCEDRLRPDYERYDLQYRSIARGIDRYEPEIPTQHGSVTRLMVRNLRVTTSELTIVDKPLPPPFPDFEAYVDYLERTYAAIVANIRDPLRRQPLQIFSTQSRGYDSTAVNAIAGKHGIDKVFTCPQARDKSAFVSHERDIGDDDGSEIGKALGFDCIPIDRLAFSKRTIPDEILYYASSCLAQDLNLVEINDHVEGGAAVLLSGTFGEIWRGRDYYDPHHLAMITHELVRVDLAQHGMSEVRLRAGLVPLPFPFLGAARRKEIYAIASSEEMQRWRAGASYEKPIARRIAEERGVPRALFGQTKNNTTVSFARPPVPHSPDIRNRYFAFLLGSKVAARWQLALLPLIHRVNELIYYASPSRHRAIYYFSRLVSKLRGRDYEVKPFLRRLDGRLFCFGVNETATRYLALLDTSFRSVAGTRGASAPDATTPGKERTAHGGPAEVT